MTNLPKQNPTTTSPLPNYTRHITTHSDQQLATIHSTTQGAWTPVEANTFAFSVAYTTSRFPATLTGDADLRAHEALLASNTLGLVNPGGTVCRVVDFAPGKPPLMHRTRSLDYGIVLEGEIEMVLDSGETRRLKRGDIAVQRGTMHAWRNPQPAGWTRMVFVLQDCEAVEVGGVVLGEDLGGAGEILPSGGKEGC
ncbi:cupin domain-containing protein [Aspergillus brunneoviolaceus CBS 621.78]|uniref:Cupin domain protein n=1 Tax=Aspergillus brunneoviolaceus CBS 621.78 TaxID=1450534 RepID=A0ACD1FWG2_9EURO|nr:cupin domain protein [Aspergillus brunneoviolaceus CBS 621.78]RAH41283.1 cupin domain protein [Aspergillus brunneoviolaceus CBS 621.78]